ncbi:Arc family DNA-binding protein [Budvicia aquatica]|uniref:Arc family DNA-binding protein n=1 Tax=Budvicia aquatica TaxID=82979 RepID=A0A2C6C300_9GAMM|nr:Arc family DNA-binding protein [Budvicia aquatica]PHI30720.1 Arc family DNA-binding protein [Budvicia aquatica]VFS50329.1 Arc-like DNA binding domain [Budvicia aquatica]
MTITSLSVRIPAEIKAKLKAQAEKNDHSMNAEIIKRLEESFNLPPLTAKPIQSDSIELPVKDVTRIKKVLKKAVKELTKKENK